MIVMPAHLLLNERIHQFPDGALYRNAMIDFYVRKR